MPLIEAQPDALAQRYARSILELAEEKGGRDKIELVLGQLEDVLELARSDAHFSEFLASRVIPATSRAASIKRIFDGRIDPLVLNFLLVLNDKGRLARLAPIIDAFDALAQDKFGRVEVDVYTAAPASGEELAGIKKSLEAKLGKIVIVHPYTDASMIGGVKLRIGDKLIDGSVATRLRRMKQRLATDGMAEIRARTKRILGDES